MGTKVRRESCGHAPLEILRQDALNGRWSDARQACRRVAENDCLDLDVLWAVLAEDADAVGAAIAKAELKPPVAERSPPNKCVRRSVS